MNAFSTPARRYLMGREPTWNPIPPAAMMLGLGIKRITAWTQSHAGRSIKRRRTGNFIPAAIAVASKLGVVSSVARKLGIGSKYTKSSHVDRFIKAGDTELARQLADQAFTHAYKQPGIPDAGEWQTIFATMHDAAPPRVKAYMDDLLKKQGLTPTQAARTPAEQIGATLASLASSPAGVTATRVLLSSATRSSRARARRPRAVTVYDPDTGDRYRVAGDSQEALSWPRTKSQLRALRGGVGSSPSSFGAAAPAAARAAGGVGANLATAGVAIGGLAAGYFIGHELNNYLAGRALGKEEAGVQAALAFRRAREAAAARKGSPLTPAELRSLSDVYKQQLIALGYDPKTFTRTRSSVERFFTGEEEP